MFFFLSSSYSSSSNKYSVKEDVLNLEKIIFLFIFLILCEVFFFQLCYQSE